MHCATACTAIHARARANEMRGTLAGLRAGQSKGWCRDMARVRQRRLQNRAGQAPAVGKDAFEEDGHGIEDGSVEELKGVVQWKQACEDTWRS